MCPSHIKIYHILHIDRLSSIIDYGGLFSDQKVLDKNLGGSTIGMKKIKQRRLTELKLNTYPDLFVGQCVPFYFCPRSIMLFMIHKSNSAEVHYQGGQESIIHLEADFMQAIDWAKVKGKRWVFTSSNAGSKYFYDYHRLEDLQKLDWKVILSHQWSDAKDKKQAEFLCEDFFDWRLIEKIGVYGSPMAQQVKCILNKTNHRPAVEIKTDWYY